MYGYSPFIDAAAVEAWDAWFRWRDRDRLRDLSIEATWQRVANALSPAADAGSSRQRGELLAALASWRLLLDERILGSAGTPRQDWPGDGLTAVLNVPMFVHGCFSSRARFDAPAFESVASLAVRALDDAMLLVERERSAAPRLRIGLVGLADALLMLGLPYGGETARRQACLIGRSLAQGCLRGTVRLAAERGGLPGSAPETARKARSRGLAESLVGEVLRHGVRHARLTAVAAQPRLALLANNVADALEPLRGENHVRRIVSSGQDRAIRSSGYALTLLRRVQPSQSRAIHIDTMATVSIRARRAMREAMRRWIDEEVAAPSLHPPMG